MADRDPIVLLLRSWVPFTAAAASGSGAVELFVSAFSSVDGWGGAASLASVCDGVRGTAGRICDAWTSHGSQPPGAWVIFAFSRPRRRGIDGPVRSMSRIPTEWPASDKESASWVVMEDLPTPPLPERT